MREVKEFDDYDLDRMSFNELQQLKVNPELELTSEQDDEIDEAIDEEVRNIAGRTVSVLTKYHICEFCDGEPFMSSTEDEMVSHIVNIHRDELLNSCEKELGEKQ